MTQDTEAVERFNPRSEMTQSGHRGTMRPYATGLWVRHADYLALAAERNALRDALVKAEAALADISEGEPDPDSVAENVWCKDRAADALPGIRAALAGEAK